MTEEKPCPNRAEYQRGCKEPAQAPHPCPYREEMGGDGTELCECCKDCEGECAMDI